MTKHTGRQPGRPKGSPPTRGSRIGRGAGWGGDAKGASLAPRLSADDAHRGEHNAVTIAAKIADRAEVLEFYTAVIREPTEATLNRIAAGDKLLDRLEGKATVGKPDDRGQQLLRVVTGVSRGDD